MEAVLVRGARLSPQRPELPHGGTRWSFLISTVTPAAGVSFSSDDGKVNATPYLCIRVTGREI